MLTFRDRDLEGDYSNYYGFTSKAKEKKKASKILNSILKNNEKRQKTAIGTVGSLPKVE